MNGGKDGQAQSNMPSNFSKVEEIKNLSSLIVQCRSLELPQVKFKIAILERISVLLKNDIRDWDQSMNTAVK